MKQAHVADLLRCSQPTITRWESCRLLPSGREAAAIARLLAARLSSAGDRALDRLVRGSEAELLLVCDVSHRLLSPSPARERHWRMSASELIGTSMWRFASAEIKEAE